MLSYNCKNIVSNQVAVKHLLDHYDIVLLQEHWLYKFQQNALGTVSTEINMYTAWSVDESNPRGMGGVAII